MANMFFNRLITHRQYFMGIAMILIILSHLLATCKEIRLLWAFYPGFIGVDIFLFLSGYGLCNSWKKNSPKEFYARRLHRILPMFLLFQIYVCFYQYITENGLSFYDAFCNLTTLSFWSVGGLCLEWYLSFLLYLYLLFPILYGMTRKIGMVFPAILLVGVLAMQYLADWRWNIDAAFSRIPVFVLGILCFISNRKTYHYVIMSIFFFIAALFVSYMFIIQKAEKYEIVYMCAPLFIMCLSYISKRITEKQNYVYQVFSYYGKITLEMYVANMITLSLLSSSTLSVYSRLIMYVTSQVILTIILVYINKIIKKKNAV